MVVIKRLINIIVTIFLLIGINFIISLVFNAGFFDYSFLVGILAMVVIKFFNSSGGYTSKQIDMQIQGTTGIRVDQNENKKFYAGSAFYTSLIYTIVSIIILVITYKDYLDF